MAWDLAKLGYWAPFSARTAAYGALSVVAGPLTRGRASVWCAHRWSQRSARARGLVISASGMENLPAPPYLMAANHQSHLDILVLGAVMPGDMKWAAKRSLMRVPFLGWHLKLAGHVPVDRGRGPKAARQVISAFEQTLSRRKPLLVFPEGTVTTDGRLRPFKLGAFRAAMSVGCPVVPVAVDGTFRLFPRDAPDPELYKPITGPRPVSVRIGRPLHADVGLDPDARLVDLRDRTHAAVTALLASSSDPERLD